MSKTPKDLDPFSVWIKHQLDTRKQTQSSLSRTVGTDRSTINKWVKGTRLPDADHKETLSKILGGDTKKREMLIDILLRCHLQELKKNV